MENESMKCEFSKSVSNVFEAIEAVGPSFTADHEDLNADSHWTADQGVRISLDVAGRTYSKEEIRQFASQLHTLVDTIEGN